MPTKPKKRGRKPGVKVGPKRMGFSTVTGEDFASNDTKIGDILKIRLPKDYVISDGHKNYSPAPVLTLCGQLEDSILLLENRISNAIAKINSLM